MNQVGLGVLLLAATLVGLSSGATGFVLSLVDIDLSGAPAVAACFHLMAPIYDVLVGQASGLEGVLLADGSLNGSALQIKTSVSRLIPNNITYSRAGCYRGAPRLLVYFGQLRVPSTSASAVREASGARAMMSLPLSRGSLLEAMH